ncbi:hypothetical protein THAOC_33934, partial [Thalassiosira oceanica]
PWGPSPLAGWPSPGFEASASHAVFVGRGRAPILQRSWEGCTHSSASKSPGSSGSFGPSASHNPSPETVWSSRRVATTVARTLARETEAPPTVGTAQREATTPSMFVFGSAAKADAEGDDGGGRGKASSSTADGAPSFAFDASFLPAVIATPTANDDDKPAAAGGFEFNVPPSQQAAAATEGEGTAPLFGSSLKSSQEVGAGVKSQTKHEGATDGGSGEQGAPIAMPSSVVSAADPLPDAVTEEELMSSGHELHESYTCPLCCLPIAPPVEKHSKLEPCCLKTLCDGCVLASAKRGMGNMCAFCRTATPDDDQARLTLVRKRVHAKDPVATEFLAHAYYDGNNGLQQDIPRAIELWTEAANLGDLDAHYRLGYIYDEGDGVEKDVARGIRHWQQAAIKGHPGSRHALVGSHEYTNENHELAVRHLMISAKMGYQESLNAIKLVFMKGHASKPQYAEALKGYQTALEETKSPQREEAKTVFIGSD